jgi:beta-ribofuranosylaminobenzene 5'-phosphate synthase
LEKLWVRSGGRLHLGQLDLSGSLGRLYGGLGIAIDQPKLEVTAEISESLSVVCQHGDEKRLSNIAREYLKHYGLPGVKIELVQPLPSHSGLGSGTSLSLALGFAITMVYGLHPSINELAVITDREGSRSGIGVAAFEQGGVLVDGGKRVDCPIDDHKLQVPPLLVRIPFPEDWAIILALPSSKRMFGRKEEKAFQSLSPMDQEVSGTVCRLLLMKLLPAVIEKNLESFGQAVEAIQGCVGSYFKPVQGGLFASAEASRIAEYMRSEGAVGVGQSSWGPTIYGFARKENHSDLLERVRKYVGEHGRVWETSGRNHGASWGLQNDH